MPALDVSIVICTCGRPEQLERLLDSLARQATTLRFEIIVVNNLPGSEMPSRSKFPTVRWLEEPRRGLSFARNAGMGAAQGPVIALVDDDIEVPPQWLEALTRPILSGEFDAVTGSVSPMKLDTEAQRLFEAYGGHGAIAERRQFDRRWLASRRIMLPLWRAGGLGNASLRRSIFEDPRVGGMEELLGVGSPSGSWEDLYYLYRMLRADYRLLHEPSGSVLHAHRETMAGLERQLCDYRRGEVCFCLLAAGRHGDPRAIAHLVLWIPYWRGSMALRESLRRLRGRRLFPFRLMWKETLAYLSGPAALRASYRRVSALRRSSR